MDFLNKIEDRLLSELEEISTKIQGSEPLPHDCLDDIKDMSEALNNFSTYMAMRESGFSQNSGYGNMNSYAMDGMSSRGQMRDSRGRYSRNSGYSRNNRMMDDWGREPYGMY